MVTVSVRDKSPKRIVRELILTGSGPRDLDGMQAVLDEWLNHNPPQKTFSAYCRAQTWTLGQVLSLLSYQCKYLGEGIDAQEFNDLWPIFAAIIKAQNLMTITMRSHLLAVIEPQPPQTRASALEVCYA